MRLLLNAHKNETLNTEVRLNTDETLNTDVRLKHRGETKYTEMRH